MTREEILAMKPGRELDKLVAEKVFNWRKVPGPKTDYDGPCESFDVLVPPTIADPFPLYPPKGVIKPWYFCEYWSTDNTAAWGIVERFKSKGYLFSLKNLVGGIYEFILTDWEGKCDIYLAQGDIPTEAICKSALLAVLEEEKA